MYENQNNSPRTEIDTDNNYIGSHDRYHPFDWMKKIHGGKDAECLLFRMFQGKRLRTEIKINKQKKKKKKR